MFGRVPGTLPNISESHSEMSTRVPFCMPPILQMLVSQTFGGMECYPREPTAIEYRLMVYLAFIHGASGVFAFSRESRS